MQLSAPILAAALLLAFAGAASAQSLSPMHNEGETPSLVKGFKLYVGNPYRVRMVFEVIPMDPKFEVVVPEKEREVASDRGRAPANIERPGVYVLQAGSYRQQSEADRIRAQLKMQGIDANVQRVSVDEDVWHRVRIGPITDLTELNRLRARLRAADFDDALVIRVGD